MNLLGQLHLSGTAVARNPVSAFRLFAEADSLGCAAASLNLGKCLFNGVGTARDLAQATAAFRRATASRDPHAWLMLGAALSEETPELDYGQDAIEAFHNAGLGGLDLGYEQLAIAAFRDDRPNPLVPREWHQDIMAGLSRQAKAGVWYCQFFLGEILLHGRPGVEKNEPAACYWLREASAASSENGVELAMHMLGMYLLRNRSSDSSLHEAAALIQAAAAKGQPEACHDLGQMYWRGLAVPQNPSRAVELWQSVNKPGNPAKVKLALAYLEGRGVKRDIARAKALAVQAAEEHISGSSALLLDIALASGDASQIETAGASLASDAESDPWASYALAMHVKRGSLPKRENREILRLYLAAADGGVSPAAFEASRYCLWGPEELRDPVKGRRLLDSAAAGGIPEAEAEVGHALVFGLGREQSVAEGIEFLQRSARQHNAHAMNSLALCYRDGIGVPVDKALAFAWFDRAMREGDAYAVANTGYALCAGEGVSRDATEGLRLLSLAQKQELGWASVCLGRLYLGGVGVIQDDKRAVDLFLEAARRDEPLGAWWLGNCYKDGRGCEKSPETAYAWYNLAAAKGVLDAENKRNELARGFSSEQLRRAQQKTNDIVVGRRSTPEADDSHQLRPGRSSGSGFFVGPSYVVTNAHVVGAAKRAKLLLDGGGVVVGEVVQVDFGLDIALIRCASDATPLLLRADRPALGEDVLVLGFPMSYLQGKTLKVSKGVVGGLEGFAGDDTAYQLSTAVQAGNSGGPAIDDRGRVIGVVQAKLDPVATAILTGSAAEHTAYCIRADVLARLLAGWGVKLGGIEKEPSRKTSEDLVRMCRKACVRIEVE